MEEEARLAEEEIFDNVVEHSTKVADLGTGEEGDELETNYDDFVDEMDWEASIQLAQSLDQSSNEDDKEEWNAARQLAEDLTDDPDENELDYDAPGLSEEESLEKLAQALRAAVERSEAERQDEKNKIERENERTNEMKLELQKADILEATSDMGFEMNHGDNNGVQSTQNYEKMTVKELKEILRGQGLKVSGRKAELIERLRSN